MTGEQKMPLPVTAEARVEVLEQTLEDVRKERELVVAELRGKVRELEGQLASRRPTLFEVVATFHAKFGLPLAAHEGGSRRPALLSKTEFKYRLGFLREELDEFLESHVEGDLPGALDALVDLCWVAAGTAHYMGLPFDEALAEVARANMSKVLAEPGDGDHKRGAAERIRKPEGWRPPMIDRVLERFGG